MRMNRFYKYTTLAAIAFIFVSVCSIKLNAQNTEALKKLESAKIGLITERLGLSPEQAEKFWPIYREFSERRRGLRAEYKGAKDNIDLNNASEQETRNLEELRLNLKEQEFRLEKEYSGKMLDVISSKQLISLRKAEDDFREMIIRRIRERNQTNRMDKEQMRQRINKQNQRRNN